MSLSTPSTAAVAANILAQIEASLGQAAPLLPKAFMRVLAAAIAGVFILVYKYAGFILLQMFVSSASAQETVVNGRTIIPLVEWGRLVGVGDPTPATRAELLIDVTVTVQTGVLAAGSQLLFSSTGVTYVTVSSVELDAATVQVIIRAASDQSGGGGVGVIGNLSPADIVSFASPLPNVARDAVVDSQVVTGANAEETEVYRQRILDRFQRRPQGGAYADYRVWGEEGAGILNIYPYTSTTNGEIDVFVEATVASSGNDDGIPTAPQLAEVVSLIELDENGLASRRPGGAAVNVLAITRTAFDVEIAGLLPDLADTRTSIEDAVDEFLRTREPFIVGLSVLPRVDRITVAAVGGVADETASALGATIASVDLTQGGSPIVATTLGDGEKAKLGTMTFV